MPKFSIIIPVYNVAPYLRECLDSLLLQTYKEWEAICIDDGSTDGSATILDEYQGKDPRFKVIHKNNAGVSAARNSGLEKAKGDYIGFVDGDDLIDKEWLCTASNLLDRTHVDLLRLRRTLFEGQVSFVPAKSGYVIYNECSVVREWGWRTFSRGGWSWLNFIRRECLKGMRFPLGVRICEDNLFMISLIPRLKSVCQGEYAGYYYRCRESSAVTRKVAASEAADLLVRYAHIVENQKPDLTFASAFVRNVRAWWVMTYSVGDPWLVFYKALRLVKAEQAYLGSATAFGLGVDILKEYARRLRRTIRMR